MEKVIAALWKVDNARLLAGLPAALHAAGARGVRLNLRDAAVAPAAGLVQQWQEPQQDAVVQFWLPSANARFRAAVDAALAAHCDRFAAWLVAESTIIANTAYPPEPGTRTWGWSQASFINFRSDLERSEAIAIWHSHHTRVAIETQSNFEYVQNLVVMPLTDGAPQYDAFVEECFPLAAMSDPHAFFDAMGDQAKFDANLASMMDSCGRFIQFGKIDIIPTSQYDFG
jgi:hypothetical protein